MRKLKRLSLISTCLLFACSSVYAQQDMPPAPAKSQHVISPTSSGRSFTTGHQRTTSGQVGSDVVAQERLIAGRKLMTIGKTDEAIQALKEAIELDRTVGAYEPLASALKQKGRIEEALDVYRRIVYKQPDQGWGSSAFDRPSVALRFALLLASVKQYDEAVSAYHLGLDRMHGKKLTEEPRLVTRFDARRLGITTFRANLHAALGMALAEDTGDWEGCAKESREALRLKPDLAIAHYYLGRSLQADLSQNSDARNNAERMALAAAARAEFKKAAELGRGDVRAAARKEAGL